MLTIFVILFIQYPIHFCPSIILNLDLIIVSKEENISVIEKIYEYYFQFIPTIEEFNNLIKNLKSNKLLCAINNSKS